MKKNIFFIFICLLMFLPTLADAQNKSQSKQAAKLSAEGDRSLQQKDYKTAVSKYAEAIALLPSLAQAHFGKGSAHIQLNETDQAIAELDAALAGGYKPLDVYRLRWSLYFAKKNYDAALDDVRKVFLLDPKNAEVNRATGEILLAKNSYQDALDSFQKFARTNPNDADVYYFIAASNNGLKNTDKQISAAREAVRRNTKYLGESYFLIAEAARENKDYAQAAEFYSKAIAAKPDINTIAYQNLADIYRRQNRFKEAVEIIKTGLQKFPDDGNFYVDLGRYLNLAERNAEAIVAGESAVKLSPENYAGYAGLCRIYYETKQFQQAQSACETALKINPADGASTVYSGFVNLSLGRDGTAKIFFKRAVGQMTEYVKNNPDYFDGFYLLGNSFYYAEQPQKAVEAYLKTLALNPNFTRARFNLGLAYFVGGNLPAAREQYNALLKTNKDLAEKLKVVIEKK